MTGLPPGQAGNISSQQQQGVGSGGFTNQAHPADRTHSNGDI